jgi:hypothetical protein
MALNRQCEFLARRIEFGSLPSLHNELTAGYCLRAKALYAKQACSIPPR